MTGRFNVTSGKLITGRCTKTMGFLGSFKRLRLFFRKFKETPKTNIKKFFARF